MHTIRRNEDGSGYTVIFAVANAPQGPIWQPVASFESQADAAAWASFMNGGADPTKSPGGGLGGSGGGGGGKPPKIVFTGVAAHAEGEEPG